MSLSSPEPRPQPPTLPGDAAALPSRTFGPRRVPIEREGGTRFIPSADVAALKAEGHYTYAYTRKGRFFCHWSISETEAALDPPFLRTHRSWLVNLSLVCGFERRKDNGYCLVEAGHGLDRAPVARGRLQAVRDALDG